MSDEEQEKPSDRTTAGTRVPISDVLPPHEDHISGISGYRRQSHTIPSPRKWKMHGLGQRVCPECRVIVPGIPDGFWHLQTAHNQGKGLDLEAWGMELRDELDEFIAASRGRRGYLEGLAEWHLGLTSWCLLATVVVLIVIGIIYATFN